MTATDTLGGTATQYYSVIINPALSILTTVLPGGKVNVPYRIQLAATGGWPWPELQIGTASLPNCAVGVSYDFSPYSYNTVGVSGTYPGTPFPGSTYNFAVTSGTLPTGLTISTSGVITGTPTTPGIFNFVVTVTDRLGVTAGQGYTVQCFGNTEIFGNKPSSFTAFAATPNRMYAFGPFGPATTGYLQSLAIHLTGAPSGNVQAALYADNGGVPDGGALLAQSASQGVRSSLWNVFLPTVSGLTTLSSSSYWIVFNTDTGGLNLSDGITGGTNNHAVFANQTFGTMPSTFPASTLISTNKVWAAYATCFY